MENPFNTAENRQKRSTLLTIFLVLTFIGSGLNFASYTYVTTSFQSVVEFVEDLAYDDDMAGFASILEQSVKMFERVGANYFGILALLSLISLVGAFFMWKLNKLGFHFYASAQIIMLFIPMIFAVEKFPGLFGTAITALFIWIYARELKIFQKSYE
jgi:peptidoglycan/LPS O-acetylase OafA/YrhL